MLTYNVFIYVYLKMFGDMHISHRFWEIISPIIEPSSSLPFLGGCETCDIYLIFNTMCLTYIKTLRKFENSIGEDFIP